MERSALMLLLLLVALPSASFSQKTSAPKDELPVERFLRKGGKTTKVKVFWDKKVGVTSKDVAQKRDLTRYEDGGHFFCGGRFGGASMGPSELEECDRVRIRNFIWNHWQNKTMGYVVFTGNSVDAVSTSHIFIEPDKNGKWHVAWRIVRHHGEIDDLPEIVQIEKRKQRSDSFILILRDVEGDEMQAL